MENYSFVYNSKIEIDEFINNNPITFDNKEVLVQVFTAVNESSYIKQIIKDIKLFIPNAKIIGTTTCGEISNKGMLINSTIISITIFKDTKLTTKILETKEDSFSTGEFILNELYNENSNKPKAIITFTDGLNTNGEDYLKGISKVDASVVVAGGMAGDNSKFEKTYVFTDDIIIDNGAVLVALYNDELNVYTNYNFNWKKLGKSHVVEKSIGNRVYQIDGMKPVDFYAEYLGSGIKDFLPAIGIEFPLVIQEDGEDIARAVLSKHDDGSLSFAGNLKEGSIVKFGYGDVGMILQDSINQIDNIHKHPIEGIFIYSCMARKALLKEDVNLEILPLKEVAPVSGFFTYGEFSHSKNKHRLLNQTMTILGLSEKTKEQTISSGVVSKESLCSLNGKEKDHTSIRNEALSKLITKTTQELEELNTHLESRVEQETQKNMEKDNIMLANARHAQLGEIIGMIAHQWRQPLSAISSSVSAMEIQKEYGMLDDKMFSDTSEQIMNYVEFLNDTIDDFRSFFKQDRKKEYANVEDIYTRASIIINTLISKYDVNIHRDFQYGEELFISTAEMTQVFLIIIKNAIDAMEEKNLNRKDIFIRSYKRDEWCVIEFEDIGGGIPNDIMHKIFEKRFTTKGDTHGTGIGLDMSKTIVEVNMDGKIEVRNGKDGAIFSIYLPISD